MRIKFYIWVFFGIFYAAVAFTKNNTAPPPEAQATTKQALAVCDAIQNDKTDQDVCKETVSEGHYFQVGALRTCAAYAKGNDEFWVTRGDGNPHGDLAARCMHVIKDMTFTSDDLKCAGDERLRIVNTDDPQVLSCLPYGGKYVEKPAADPKSTCELTLKEVSKQLSQAESQLTSMNSQKDSAKIRRLGSEMQTILQEVKEAQ